MTYATNREADDILKIYFLDIVHGREECFSL